MEAAFANRPTGKQTAVLLIGSLGCAMTVLDTNVVGIVLPTIARDLQASFAEVEWVISAYVLCFASLLLPAGSIADRYGRKRVFLCGIALFALASLACGLAPSASTLYVARAAQGASAAFLLAPALAIVGHAFHEESARGRAWAVWGGIMGLTMVLSPLLGGTINSLLGWRWAFHVNVPICAVLGAAVLRWVRESRDPTPRPLDFPGIVLFASGMFAVTWALILGPAHGWVSGAVLSRAAAGLGIFTMFCLVEQRRPHPMLDLALFKARPFVGAVVAMFAYAASAQVMASVLPLFLQNARGNTALAAGVGMLPFALAMLVFPQVGRRLSPWLDGPGVLTLGLGIVALGNVIMAYAAQQAGQGMVITGMALLGTGGGLLNGETQKAIMGTVPPHRAGMASGVSTTARFSGILLGFASLGAVLASNVGTSIRMALQAPAIRHALEAAHIHVQENFAGRVVAGDLEGATATYPANVARALSGIARDAYAHGFSRAFMLAAAVAAACAIAVLLTMRATAASGTRLPRLPTDTQRL
jgi:EmrB/QacA subfamily drug resistance transporter